MGYHPQIILAGRRINDGMGTYVTSKLVKAMLKRQIRVDGSRALVLGLTFKENCPDLRNTRVVDVILELREYGVRVDVHDPWANAAEAKQEYGLDLITKLEPLAYDVVVLATAHDSYQEAGAVALRGYGRPGHVFYDLKSVFARNESDLRL
jgi:UDP-N-acetyl-D-galactosamine dehydrogenase